MRQVLASLIPRGSIVLAVTTFGSYVLGWLRDKTFAHTFGPSTSLDSYNAAFLVPDFAFNFLVASGIAAAVVPIFTELHKRSRRTAYLYVNSIMTSATAVMAVTGVLTILAAPWLSRLVVPGLAADQQALVAQLMRIIALSPILFAASNALGAMLVAQQRFFLYGLSPIMYNLGIIAGTLWLVPQYGVVGVAYGTVLGAGLHLIARLVDAVRSGWTPYPLRPWPVPALRETLRLMLPKMVGHPIELVTFGVFTRFASFLPAGSITMLNFARNYQSVPVSIIGISMATAVFPILAQTAVTSPQAVRRQLRETTRSILLASSAAALVMFAIRRPLVQVLLGGGEFDADDVQQTATVLGAFCLSIPTESLSHLFARAFYAKKNTVIPVVFSVVSLVVAAGSAYGLSRSLGLVGLPLAFFLGSLAKTVGLWSVFTRRLADT